MQDGGLQQDRRRQQTLLAGASEKDRAFVEKVEKAKQEADEESVSLLERVSFWGWG